jgi:diguanylate cyclase (GGDEF)-like protein/PAS domain S-box-containing protein
VEPERTLRALFVDVSPEREEALRAALTQDGWSLRAECARGTDALATALLHRGWQAVIYAGDGDAPVPTRKALAMVRLADPHLCFIAFSAPTEAHDLLGVVKGFERGVLVAQDPETVTALVAREVEAREERRGESGARRLLLAQQAVTDQVAAGLEPEALYAQVLATLGDTLGFSYGAVWQPSGEHEELECAAGWHPDAAPAAVLDFAEAVRKWRYAPGRGLPGRVWAFRRPIWAGDVATDHQLPRADLAHAAGLHTAVAFPVAIGDRCLGVIEFFDPAMEQPDGDLQALFATVGGQLAQYLERRRLQADESRRVEAMLRAERDRAQRYLDVAACIICVADADGRIELVNRKGCDIIGRSEEELLGLDWIDVAVAPAHRSAAREVYGRLVSGELEANDQFETAVTAGNGESRVIAWHTTLLRDAEGRIVGTLAAGDDVTERRRSEQQITFLAYHDALTGLPNRTLLEEHLKLALARSRRTGAGLALLHVGVDNFKLVNDSLGHARGDELLSRLAVRLQEEVRATDLLARVGGDEFLLLLADLHDEPTVVAERVAGQIVESLSEPFGLGGAEFQMTASIGISVHPRDADNAESLLNHADTAMYQAKEVARGGWAVYSGGDGDPLQRLSLSARMRRALERHEFLLHYQPIFALECGEMQGVEALIRWRDPEHGMVPPGDFIPLAEETGMIESIGDWVFRAVCEQQVDWGAKGFTPQISFNVSPRQLRRLDFADRVSLHLRETGADPNRLTLELTESSTLQDPAAAEPILRAIHELGLRIALDDFGSGYSSLSRLRDMPVETLKIDRAFMREVPENREAAAIVTAILRLSRALGRTAVAEGVETDAQRRFLRDQRCQLAQGFLLGRPLPPEEVEALMAAA